MNLLIHKLPPNIESSLTFLENRVMRIIPPYWFFTVLVVLAFVASRGQFNVGHLSGDISVDYSRFLLSILLLPQSQPPILGLGWTLIYEFQFYLLCSLVIILRVNRRPPEILAFLSILAVILSILNISLLHGYALSTFYIEFLFGALAHRLLNRITAYFPILQILMALVCDLFLSHILDFGLSREMISIVHPLGAGLVGFLLISWLIGADGKYSISTSVVGTALMRIGNASYTLYLVHWFVLSIMGKLIGFVPGVSIVVVAAWHRLSIAAAIVFATVLAERVELPFHRKLLLRFNRFKLSLKNGARLHQLLRRSDSNLESIATES